MVNYGVQGGSFQWESALGWARSGPTDDTGVLRVLLRVLAHPRSQRLNVELPTALSAVKSSLRWGESPSPRVRQEKPTSNPRPGCCHFLWPVTQCHAGQSLLLSHNFTLVVTQCHAWLSRFVQLREEYRIMEPHLGLKWGSHLHHELGALFLKHNHEW